MEQVDWIALAQTVGAFSLSDTTESYSSAMAPIALDHILGDTFLHDAVECCLDLRRGWGVAELVLIRLESPTAMQYCYTVYTTADDPSRRTAAAGLLGTIGNHQAASYIRQFLADPEIGVQQAGMKLLRRWMHYTMDDPGMLEQLVQAEQHASPAIREEAQHIRSFITYATTFDQQYQGPK